MPKLIRSRRLAGLARARSPPPQKQRPGPPLSDRGAFVSELPTKRTENPRHDSPRERTITMTAPQEGTITMPATISSRPGAQSAFPISDWMRGVADDQRIVILHRLVLFRLGLHRHDGQCAPGYDAVALELGVHRATVFRAVAAGIKRGWIAPRADHGGRTPARLALTFPMAPPDLTSPIGRLVPGGGAR